MFIIIIIIIIIIFTLGLGINNPEGFKKIMLRHANKLEWPSVARTFCHVVKSSGSEQRFVKQKASLSVFA